MGGTWKLWLENEARRQYTAEQDAYKQRQTLLLRQIVYHLSMWRSIANTPKRTRYMSKYVALFIDKFKLSNPDDPAADADASSDDEPEAPSLTDLINAELAQPAPQQQPP